MKLGNPRDLEQAELLNIQSRKILSGTYPLRNVPGTFLGSAERNANEQVPLRNFLD